MTSNPQDPLTTPAGHTLAPAPTVGPYHCWASATHRVITRPRQRGQHVTLLRLGDRTIRTCDDLATALAQIDAELVDTGNPFDLNAEAVSHG